jgi:hypothetical protein
MKRSRRRFLRLLAAGSVAAVAAPAAAVAQAAPPKKAPKGTPGAKSPAGGAAKPVIPAALAEEIKKQKALVEQTLKAVRAFPLPPGSEPAFTFVPLEARGREPARRKERAR